MNKTPDFQTEFELIDWLKSRRLDQSPHVATGIGDDMAVLQVGREQICFATDTLLDGVHFDAKTHPLELIGYKALAVNLSDSAAMAAAPIAAVAAISIPKEFHVEQIRELFSGIQNCAEKFGCPLVGGDTTTWINPLAITVSVISQPFGERAVLRTGARAGDAILVTGELGGSPAGRHLEFVPRLEEVKLIAERAEIHAMIDISDGLGQDLSHICRDSGVAALLDAVSIPLSGAARKSADPLAAAMGDGEDFELLFCVSPADCDKLLADWKNVSKTRLNCIGQILPADSAIPDGKHRIYLRDGMNGKISPVEPIGWQHGFGQ